MSNPKLALIPSGYKSGKVYSILPNDATGDFDFTRQSIGTRVRKDGLIEEAKTSGSITNLILNSEDFSTNWTNFNGASISTNQTLAPDGTNTADKIVSNGTNYSFTRPSSNITVTNAKYYTASIYVKADVETIGYIRCDYGTLIYNRKFNLSTGTLSTGFDNTANIPEAEKIEELANGWYRISITDIVDTVSFEMRIYCTDGSASSGDSLFLWGAMVSEGALSDYIKTEGSQVTETVETFTDVPRLDWLNSNCPSLLLEPQRTNYALNNTQLHLNNTLNSTATITKTGNYAISPDGTLTATRLQASGTSGYALLSVNGTNPTIDGDGSGYYRSSVYVKSNTGATQTIAFYGSSTQGSLTHEIGNEWKRIDFLAYRPANSKYSYLGLHINNGSDDELDFLAWGGQTELVNSYASSLIITPSTSTVTRLKDFISGGGNADLFNSLEGTFFVEMASFLNAQTNSNGIELSDSSGQNRVTIQYDTTNNQIRAEIKLANVTQALLFTTSYDVTNFNKIAVTYKYNEAKLYINGSLISTDTSVNIFAEDTLTEVRSTIAGISSSAFNLQAKIKDLRVYDRVLTEAEAIELTTI